MQYPTNIRVYTYVLYSQEIDVSNEESIRKAGVQVRELLGECLNILINNA